MPIRHTITLEFEQEARGAALDLLPITVASSDGGQLSIIDVIRMMQQTERVMFNQFVEHVRQQEAGGQQERKRPIFGPDGRAVN